MLTLSFTNQPPTCPRPSPPLSLCIIHRKALCTVVQNSGGDVIVAASVAPDCHLGWIHATGENAHLFSFVGVASSSSWGPPTGHETHYDKKKIHLAVWIPGKSAFQRCLKPPTNDEADVEVWKKRESYKWRCSWWSPRHRVTQQDTLSGRVMTLWRRPGTETAKTKKSVAETWFHSTSDATAI